jgi:hypothetical protein
MKYQATEKGRAAKVKYQAKYRASEKGRAVNAKHEMTEKRVISRRRAELNRLQRKWVDKQ